MSRDRTCPICTGKVAPLRHSREDPDVVLDRHIADCHPDEVRAARKALGLMTKNDLLAELGSAFRLNREAEEADDDDETGE